MKFRAIVRRVMIIDRVTLCSLTKREGETIHMALVSRLPSVFKAAACLSYQNRSFAMLTAEEAGRRAAELMAERQAVDSTSKALATILSHAGTDKIGANIPMAPPLHTATTYTRPPDGNYQGYGK
jgi:hypothetical protein